MTVALKLMHTLRALFSKAVLEHYKAEPLDVEVHHIIWEEYSIWTIVGRAGTYNSDREVLAALESAPS